MSPITAFDDLETTTLDRLVLIQKTIPSVLAAVPYFWATPTPPYTLFMNFVPLIVPDDAALGAGWVRDTMTVTMRAIWGSLASGTRNETEKRYSANKYAALNRFRQSPHLNHPTTKAKLTYLAPSTRARITQVTSKGVNFDQSNPNDNYLITDYTLTVTFNVTVGVRES